MQLVWGRGGRGGRVMSLASPSFQWRVLQVRYATHSTHFYRKWQQLLVSNLKTRIFILGTFTFYNLNVSNFQFNYQIIIPTESNNIKICAIIWNYFVSKNIVYVTYLNLGENEDGVRVSSQVARSKS